MNKASRTDCPDCGGKLNTIQILDRTAHSSFKAPTCYAAEDAKGTWFSGVTPTGTLRGRMCEECGRVLLYAEPNKPG